MFKQVTVYKALELPTALGRLLGNWLRGHLVTEVHRRWSWWPRGIQAWGGAALRLGWAGASWWWPLEGLAWVEMIMQNLRSGEHHWKQNCYSRLRIRHEKRAQTQTSLSPDIFRWGRGLPREGVGAKKFSMPFETRQIKLFWRDIPGFCRDIPELLEKFEKKFVFNFRPLQKRPFVDSSVRNFRRVRNLGWVFVILFEGLLVEIQEEIHHFAVWGGGVKGHQNCEQNFCEQTGVS